jgi:UDP-N-acetylmuramoyl-L-alanyl-D-glutamate--2,6-diaminopimelate ligase
MNYGGRVSGRTIGSVLKGLAVTPLRGAESVVAERVVEDSRQVGAGDVFLARGGAGADGRAYVRDAEAAGAVAVLSDTAGCAAASGPALEAADVERVGAAMAHRLQGDPSSRLPVVGVTGTNGKTTVTTLIQHLAGGSSACGLLGGVVVDDGRHRRPARLTTPMAADVANWLGAVHAHGCRAAVMEVSSHALHQGRVNGVHLAVAIFTNLSGDHLDYHDTLAAYAACKRSMFETLAEDAVAVVNMDDAAGASMAEASAAPVVRCSLTSEADVAGHLDALGPDGLTLRIRSGGREVQMHAPLIGRHNAMNLLQAVAAAEAIGVPLELCAERAATAIAPPGRLEMVSSSPQVLVDFAHTDGALAAVLASLRELGVGKIIVVVGCGGDRDRTKRPRMAAVACRGADAVWLTSDNPRTESPDAILQDMLEGVPAEKRDAVTCEVDRAAAIAAAIGAAGPEDCVLIAGKGHETVQLVGGASIPFDDRAVAAASLGGLGGRT